MNPSRTPHWRDIADPMCCGQSDTLPLCSNCPLRDNRSPATNYAVDLALLAQGMDSFAELGLRPDEYMLREWSMKLRAIGKSISAPSEMASSEALKLAEEWKGRGDDAGRLSRAVIDSAVSAIRRSWNGATIFEAVARGWCSPENSGKEFDAALGEAIAKEVIEALGAETAFKSIGMIYRTSDGVIACSLEPNVELPAKECIIYVAEGKRV